MEGCLFQPYSVKIEASFFPESVVPFPWQSGCSLWVGLQALSWVLYLLSSMYYHNIWLQVLVGLIEPIGVFSFRTEVCATLSRWDNPVVVRNIWPCIALRTLSSNACGAGALGYVAFCSVFRSILFMASQAFVEDFYSTMVRCEMLHVVINI